MTRGGLGLSDRNVDDFSLDAWLADPHPPYSFRYGAISLLKREVTRVAIQFTKSI